MVELNSDNWTTVVNQPCRLQAFITKKLVSILIKFKYLCEYVDVAVGFAEPIGVVETNDSSIEKVRSRWPGRIYWKKVWTQFYETHVYLIDHQLAW